MVAVGRACGLVGALVAIVPAVGHAGNGLNPIGFGLESNAMGGADLAVARDPFALGTNPAGIAQLHGLNLELHGGAARELGIRHEDQFNADAGLRNEYVPEVNFGVTDQLGPYPICVGLNLAATGGGGYDYGRIATPFGNEDRLSSLFGIVRASVGAATYVASGVAVGASFGLSYARLDQDFFSDTSVLDAADPSRSFFGTKIEAGQAIGTGFRLGALWQVSDRLTFGAAYGSKVELPIESGRLDVNMSAQGLGKVQYDDLKLKGLAQAQELGVGASYRITPRWLVAADLAWLNWSDALTTTTLRARPRQLGGSRRSADHLRPGLARPVRRLGRHRLSADRAGHPVGRVQLRPQPDPERAPVAAPGEHRRAYAHSRRRVAGARRSQARLRRRVSGAHRGHLRQPRPAVRSVQGTPVLRRPASRPGLASLTAARSYAGRTRTRFGGHGARPVRCLPNAGHAGSVMGPWRVCFAEHPPGSGKLNCANGC